MGVSVRPAHGGEGWIRLALMAGRDTSATAAVAFVGGFGARFFEAVSQNGFGMCGRPAIGKHLFELAILGVEPHQKFSNIRPRFNPMSFCTGQDRVQYCRPWSGIFTPQEQPVLTPDRLVAQRPFAHVVVDRQPSVRRVTP